RYEHDEHEKGRREQSVYQSGEDEELDRADAEEREECAADRADTDQHVEERCVSKRTREAPRLVKERRQRGSTRSGKDRDGEHSGTDEAEREQGLGHVARRGLE